MNELYHHGIKGQKWGVRRFQNEDGSLKPAGEGRYYTPVKKRGEPQGGGPVGSSNGHKAANGTRPTNGKSQTNSSGSVGGGAALNSDAEEPWEENLYKELEETWPYALEDVAKQDLSDFILTLGEFGGMDTDKITNEEAIRIRKKVAARYAGKGKTSVKHNDDTDYLAHHGILGMKWGVRRYQNYDGTLTELGKRRIASEKGDSAADYTRKAHGEAAIDSNYLRGARASASEGANNAARALRISANAARAKAASKINLSDLSDSDLQAMVNRLNLERNFKSLSTASVASGRERAASALEVIGTIAAIGASTAAIATAIHQIKAR